MDIVIIGGGGAVGRQVTQMIVSERLLQRYQRLVLVGNRDGESARTLYGYVVDLMDAYAEHCPKIEVVLDPEEISGDLIVMAGGATIPQVQRKNADRDSLAKQNLPVFEKYASALEKNGCGYEIVICVSNPNELAVASFARHLGRKRVIGMGAFLDSWRFRKEIALDLGIERQRIHGFVAGEHGNNIVPLWSSINIYGYKDEDVQDAIKKMRRGYTTAGFPLDYIEARRRLEALVEECRIQEAYALIDSYPPDLRVALKPLVTHLCGLKTTMGTARATLALVQVIESGNDALVAGQVKLEGEFYGLHSTIGAPFVVGNKGVDRIIQIPISDEEKDLLVNNAVMIQSKIESLFADFDRI